MADVLTDEQRKLCMSRIKGRDTKPELALRKALWAQGLRYRKHSRLPGRPDVVFPGPRVVVFVDGCFWHRCPDHFVSPSNNACFWKTKIDRNVQRDKGVNSKLQGDGWRVVRLWEHEIRENLDQCVQLVEEIVRAKRDLSDPT